MTKVSLDDKSFTCERSFPREQKFALVNEFSPGNESLTRE